MPKGLPGLSGYRAGRDMVGGGIMSGIGNIGRRSTSTPDVKMLARSGKARSAAVAGGLMGFGAMRKRRGPGTSRTMGRPTGMYGF